jgi:pimeloyl-ACP methyl ester carboxylesterase/DNA-binding SARP family transcriptional activator
VLCLLGKPALVTSVGMRPLELRPKALALLVRIALTDEPQTRSVLAELLFPEAVNPRDSLRWYLSHLRARLPGAVSIDGSTASVTVTTDVEAFRRGAERILADPSSPDAVGTLALYRGDLCAGLAVRASVDFDNWLYVEEDELSRLFRQAALAFGRKALADGHAAAAIPSLRQLASVDPYLEEAHVLLVQATEAAGEPMEARRAYDRYQRIVRTALHAEPRRDLVHKYEPGRPAGRELPFDELVPLRDITMHIVDWPGEEPPILAVPGSAGVAYRLTALGEMLAPTVRFIAASLRGHGYSDKPPSGYAVEDHVEDLLQLINALSLSKPVLLGHSLGGPIATFVAEAAGDDVGGLILFDAVVGDAAFVEAASFVLEEIGPALERRFVSFEEYLAFWDDEDDGSQWARWIRRAERMSVASLSDGTYRRMSLREALAAEWASVAKTDSLQALSRVTAPVLVVHADAPAWYDRPYIDLKTVQAQMAAARDARLFIARGQHHGDIVLRPSDDLIEAVVAFAREIRARNAPAR